jgi:hypothetical protein
MSFIVIKDKKYKIKKFATGGNNRRRRIKIK